MSQVDAMRMEDDPAMEAGTVTPFPDQSGRRDAARTVVLVFTRDATLIDTVRKAAPRDATVIHAPDLDQASDQLPTSQPDVVVLDAASAPDVARMAAQITRQFPDLVIIVAGRREESASLMKLTATGQVYRFLLVPLAVGQTRLTLEAALRRHVERSIEGTQPVEASTPAPPEKPGNSRTLVFAGIVVVAVAAIAGWFFTQPDSGNDASVSTTSAVPAAAEKAATPAATQAQAELALATQAMEKQQYVEPAGTSALDHYRAALAIDSGNAQALAGIQSVADRIVENAETALLAEKLDQAVAALELARNIQPTHARLTFLDSQVQRERERLQLTQARDVNTRLRNVLNSATQRMETGRLLTPAGQSARDALQEARRIDATDPAVIQGYRDLTNRVLNDADRALSAGQREQAAILVAAARELSPSEARVAAFERALADPAQTAPPARPVAPAAVPTAAAETVIARARLAEGRLLDPAGDSARDHLQAARTADANDAETQRLLVDLKTKLIDSGRQSLGTQDVEGAERALRAAADLGVRGNEETLAAAQRDLDRQRADRDFRRNVVSAGSLNRTRTVQPEYPEVARRRGVEGWVDVTFTVTPTGTVTDAAVTSSNPADVFDAAAIAAISNWRFEPVVRAGSAVPQRAAARLRFDIQN